MDLHSKKTLTSNFNRLIGVLFSLILLTQCEESPPNVTFDAPVKGKLINLSRKIGDSFQVIRDTDTITYHLFYDKNTKSNYLVKSISDTVFVGTITKRNELYLLNHHLKNGDFVIHALKFTDTTVTGLETEWVQSVIIANKIDTGNFTNLTTDTTTIKTIAVGKRDGKEIFRFVIDQLKSEHILYKQNDLFSNSEFNSTSVLNTSKIIKSVYPNPFVNQITIELNEIEVYEFNLFDSQGRLIKNETTESNTVNMYLPNLKSGFYFLHVRNITTDSLDQYKIIKN